MAHTNEMVLAKMRQLYETLFRHDGFGEMRIEMRILKRGQKEVVIHCGKQYRYVVDYPGRPAEEGTLPGEADRVV
jgi:hypothetical protein